MIPESTIIELSPAGLDEALLAAPTSPAVFLLWPREGRPYWSRTASLRRRLMRLLKKRETPSRLLNLREVATRVEYWPAGSRLETFIYSWAIVRKHFPDDYRKLLRLRMPPYVKLILTHDFPRTQITSQLSSTRALFFGPFRNRSIAERFESELLDLFQIRRCPEDFDPSPDHPGCIYGEMNRCLRPCQEVVGVAEYASEVERVSEFLSTGGASLLRVVASARERASDELDFEEAARQHQQYERIQQALRLRDELARDIARLDGVAVVPSAAPEAVELWFVRGGAWCAPRRFELLAAEGKPVSLDRRLRELAGGLESPQVSTTERQEHLAILARWYYSSWRDGEWLPVEGIDAIPYRKLVNAIHRVATRKEAPS